MSMSVLQTGISGVQSGLNNMRRDAAEIANAGTSGDVMSTELTRSLINLQVDQRQVEASVKVIMAADEMLGTLLDERA